jgi:hypothetical protein
VNFQRLFLAGIVVGGVAAALVVAALNVVLGDSCA